MLTHYHLKNLVYMQQCKALKESSITENIFNSTIFRLPIIFQVLD